MHTAQVIDIGDADDRHKLADRETERERERASQTDGVGET
jgi:hypothetical protein